MSFMFFFLNQFRGQIYINEFQWKKELKINKNRALFFLGVSSTFYFDEDPFGQIFDA